MPGVQCIIITCTIPNKAVVRATHRCEVRGKKVDDMLANSETTCVNLVQNDRAQTQMAPGPCNVFVVLCTAFFLISIHNLLLLHISCPSWCLVFQP